MTEKMPKDQTEFASFMEDVGASRNCPVCKKSGWAISYADDELNVSLSLAKGKKEIPGRWLVCNNCGFVRLHSAAVFEEWKEKKDKEDV